jgi:hypothetical protein
VLVAAAAVREGEEGGSRRSSSSSSRRRMGFISFVGRVLFASIFLLSAYQE